MQVIKTFIFIFVCVWLCSCSSRHTPAPVSSLGSNPTKYKTKKVIIKKNHYTVRKGDTLFSIAFSANADIRVLARINKLKSPYTIYPGQKIVLNKKYNKPKKPNKSLANPKLSKQLINKSTKKELDKSKQQEYVRKRGSNKKNLSKRNYRNLIYWSWPVKGTIIKRFSIKENGFKGIQIKNRKGTPVSAAADGVVVYAGNALRGYGNLIIVKHNEEYLSAYAHNAKILVKEHQSIKVGQKIAEMGSTGAKITALRFEIRFKGKAVNPAHYLPKSN